MAHFRVSIALSTSSHFVLLGKPIFPVSETLISALDQPHTDPLSNAMEAFAAIISTTQAVAYTLAVAKGLAELRNALKHGRCFLQDEKTSVDYLQEIITRLVPEEETDADPGLYHLLQSINITVTTLLDLFKHQKRRHLIYTLVVRRTEVNDSFASLERKKNTLILHLTAQNSAAISFLKASSLAQFPQACQMSKHNHPTSLVSIVTF